MQLNYKELLKTQVKTQTEIILDEIIREQVMPEIIKSIEKTNQKIISELPTGNSSSIAKALTYEVVGNTINVITTDIVWDWLDKGTGIYNPTYAGQGEGGAIIPINSKALHFKNREISVALGFKDENVFLKKIKGIKPRWYFERHYYLNPNLFNF